MLVPTACFPVNCTLSCTVSLLVVCHHGNDSQLAVKLLKENLKPPEGSTNAGPEVKDIIGGLSEWANSIDPAFPKY